MVIGILIALQINLANEERKKDDIRQNYYEQLIFDLDREIENLKPRLDTLRKRVVAYEKYQEIVQTPNKEPIEVVMAQNEVNWSFSDINFNYNTYETLESTGDLKLIPRDLRNKLSVLVRNQKDILRWASKEYEFVQSSQRRAMELGYSPLGQVFYNYQPDIMEKKDLNQRIINIMFTVDTSLMQKYYTDMELIKLFEAIILECQDLIELIRLEMEE